MWEPTETISLIGIVFSAASIIVIVTWKVAGNYHTRENLDTHVDNCERRYNELHEDLNGIKNDLKDHKRETKSDLKDISRKLDGMIQREMN